LQLFAKRIPFARLGFRRGGMGRIGRAEMTAQVAVASYPMTKFPKPNRVPISNFQ
jgi:hypothetical protein